MNSIPEIGQFTNIRKRPALVRNVETFKESRSGQDLHMIDVEYIDDYSYPPEDKLIWEREVGAKTLKILDYPDISSLRPDLPERFEAFINAMRWSSNTLYSLTDNAIILLEPPIISPWYSSIQIKEYQLFPVWKSLSMPRVNLLLADDVGLGKTIEAGLITQELIRQRRLRRIMIVCPSSLQIQWKDEMKEKFNLDFTILDSEQVLETQRDLGLDSNPWTIYPRIITSMDYIKQPDILDRFERGSKKMQPEESALLPWDLLIVDEAHNYFPSRMNDESARCKMLRTLSRLFEHRLFLTATPHNGYTQSFTGLLEILDPVRFRQKFRMTEKDYEQLKLIMVRRMKSDLKNTDMGKLFTDRYVEGLKFSISEREGSLFKALKRYREHSIEILSRKGKKEKNLGAFLFSLLTKRLLSSSYSFARTWWTHVEGIGERYEFDEADRSRETAEVQIEDDSEKDLREKDATRISSGWLSEYRSDLEPYMREVSICLNGLGWTREIISKGVGTIKDLPKDMKWESLLEWIDRKLIEGRKFKNDERLIIFTEYKDTLDYLKKRLEESGISYPQLQILYGGSQANERKYVKDEFNDPNSQLRILLATDVASEGLNLQTSCRYVIHQELPWNPMRLEQRNGRVDRFGQYRDVFVHHFFSDEVEDLKFLDFIAKKINQVREDLGSVGTVIDEAVSEYFTTGKEIKIDFRVDTALNLSDEKQDMESSRDEVDYKDTLKRFEETKKVLGIDENRMAQLLDEACKLDEGEIQEQQQGIFEFIRVPPKWEKLVQNTLTTEIMGVSDVKQRMVFSPKMLESEIDGMNVFKQKKGLKLITLGHPLMNRAVGSFRSKLWEPGSNLKRWTIIRSDFNMEWDRGYEVFFQISLRNDLGERYQTGLTEIPFVVKNEMVVRRDRFECRRETILKEDEIKEELYTIRSEWGQVASEIERCKTEMIQQLTGYERKRLEKERERQTGIHTEMFEHQRRSLEEEMGRGDRYINKLMKELERAEAKVRQLTFSPELDSQHRQMYNDLKNEIREIQEGRSDTKLEELKKRLEIEEERIMKRIIPKRYSLAKDGVDILVIGVKVHVHRRDR